MTADAQCAPENPSPHCADALRPGQKSKQKLERVYFDAGAESTVLAKSTLS